MEQQYTNRESRLNQLNRQRITVEVPFKLGDDGYFTNIYSTVDAIKNDIEALIFTDKYERVMRPTFGIGIRRFLFEPNDDEQKASLMSQISDALNKYFSFVNLKSFNVLNRESDSTLNDNSLRIILNFEIKYGEEIELLSIDKILTI